MWSLIRKLFDHTEAQTISRRNSIRLGTLMDATQHPIQLDYDQTAVHVAILGGSGSGKSKCLELVLRHFLLDDFGFCFIDPHGDTAQDLLAFVAARKAHPDIADDGLWRKIHYLKVTPTSAFSYDPFANAPLRSEVSRKAYDSWLDTKVDFLCRAILRNVSEAQREIMNRLKRWLRNILFACGTSFDKRNSHHGLDKMLIFTDPQHASFESHLDKVAPFLKDYVLLDFLKLKGTKRPQDQEKWVESTINKLRDVLSTLVMDVFSQRRPSINIPEIIRKGEFLIVDLGQTHYWSYDQKVTLGGMLIAEVLLAKLQESELPPSRRRRFALAIDESGEFLGEDLKHALGATRKFQLPVILAAQDLSTFVKGDLDLAPKVLSMCQTVVCFQNTYRKDKEILADRMGAGNIDFTRKLVEVQRQRGWIERQMQEHSYGTDKARNWSEGKSEMHGESENEIINEMISLMQGRAQTHSRSKGIQNVISEGQTGGYTMGRAAGASPIIVGNRLVGMIPTASANTSLNNSNSITAANGESETEGNADTNSHALTVSQGQGTGKGKQKSKGKQSSVGGSQRESHTVAHKTHLLPNIVSEQEWTGLYEAGTVNDQFEMLMQQIHCLSTAEAIICRRGDKQSFPVKIREVKEWWTNEDDKFYAIQRLQNRIRLLHPYYFDPEQEDSTGEFLVSHQTDDAAATDRPQESDDDPMA